MNSLQNGTDSNQRRIERLAYKYWKQKRFANCSAEENWYRAEKQLGYSQSNHRPFFDEQADRIKPISELISRSLTIGTGLSTVPTALGPVFLIAYLHRVGAPMPPIDSSMSVFVVFLAVVFIALSSAFMMILFLPFMIKYSEPSLADIYPTLFYKNPVQEGWEYVKHYGVYFSPFLVGLAGLFVSAFIDPKNPTSFKYVVFVGWALGVLIEFLYLKHQDRYKGMKYFDAFRAVASYLWVSFCASTYSFLWMAFVGFLAAPLFDLYFTSISDRLAWGLFLAFIVFSHVFLNTLLFRFSWKWKGRSPSKVMERTHEEATEALHAGRKSRHSQAASAGEGAGLEAVR